MCLCPCLTLFVSPLFDHSRYMSTDSQRIVGGVLVGTGLWVTIIMIMRNVLKSLLSWHGWMNARHGSVSWSTRLWMVSLMNVFLCSSHFGQDEQIMQFLFAPIYGGLRDCVEVNVQNVTVLHFIPYIAHVSLVKAHCVFLKVNDFLLS